MNNWKLSPAAIATFRAVVLAIVTLIVSLGLEYLTHGKLPDWLVAYAPIIVFFLREIEGVVDQIRNPKQNIPPEQRITSEQAENVLRRNLTGERFDVS